MGVAGIGGYLPFKRDTNGLVWEFGSKLVYQFDVNRVN